MIIFILTIILNVFSTSSCYGETQENPDIAKKIIGGHYCSTEKYPFVVSLRKASSLKHFCGGNLIAEDWVLTAAHCLEHEDPHYYNVVAGVSEYHTRGIQRQEVKAVFKHSGYRKHHKRYDIALVHLSKPFNLSTKYVAKIALPSSEIVGDMKDNCSEAIVIGWGHRDPWDPRKPQPDYVFNPILQCVSIPVLTDQQCTNLARTGKPLTKNVVCAYSHNGTRDACQGDSGGPLTCNDTLFGVVSSGYGCGLPDTPGFYTRVDRYLDFIANTMSGHQKFRTSRSRSSNKIISVYDIVFLICILHFIYFFVGCV